MLAGQFSELWGQFPPFPPGQAPGWRPSPLTLLREHRVYFRSKYCIGGKPMAALRVDHALFPSMRLDRRQIPFYTSWVRPDWDSSLGLPASLACALSHSATQPCWVQFSLF